MMTRLILLALVALAACEPFESVVREDAERLNEAVRRDLPLPAPRRGELPAERPRGEAIDDLPKAEASDAPVLRFLTRETIERELTPGAGCDLNWGRELLLIATAEDAIASFGKEVVHLRRESSGLEALQKGGVFIADDVRVIIDPAGEETRSGETRTRRATVTIEKGNARREHPGKWTCGA